MTNFQDMDMNSDPDFLYYYAYYEREHIYPFQLDGLERKLRSHLKLLKAYNSPCKPFKITSRLHAYDLLLEELDQA